MSEDPNNIDPKGPTVRAKGGGSVVVLGALVLLGVAIVAVTLWVIFGAPSAQRPAAGKAHRKDAPLSRDELTVIVADDDATEAKELEQPRTKPPQEERGESPPSRRLDVEPAHRDATPAGAPDRPKGAGTRD